MCVRLQRGGGHLTLYQASNRAETAPAMWLSDQSGGWLIQSKNYDNILASVVTFTLKGQNDVDYNVQDWSTIKSHDVVNMPSHSNVKYGIDVSIGMDYYNLLMDHTKTELNNNYNGHLTHSVWEYSHQQCIKGSSTVWLHAVDISALSAESPCWAILDTGGYSCKPAE